MHLGIGNVGNGAVGYGSKVYINQMIVVNDFPAVAGGIFIVYTKSVVHVH